MSLVKTKHIDHIAILTIDRPEALNAINTQVLFDLDEAVTAAEKDPNVYVIILSGEGRSFVAGADIGEMVSFTSIEGYEFSRRGVELFLKIENLSKPVIAAINGFALGGGCELAMACDIRLASEKAKFGQPETAIGVIPGFAGTQRLSRIVGSAKAMELIFTSMTISAREAKEIGLVSYVYPPEELMDKAIEMASLISKQGQLAVRQAKRCIRVGLQTDIHTAGAFESEAFGVICGTEDKKEGMTAFLEKRAEKHFTLK